jgi:hypothetical protein
MTFAEAISMTDDDHDMSFLLELEAASKALCIVGDRNQAEHLKQLIEELAGKEPSGEPDQFSTVA